MEAKSSRKRPSLGGGMKYKNKRAKLDTKDKNDKSERTDKYDRKDKFDRKDKKDKFDPKNRRAKFDPKTSAPSLTTERVENQSSTFNISYFIKTVG